MLKKLFILILIISAFTLIGCSDNQNKDRQNSIEETTAPNSTEDDNPKDLKIAVSPYTEISSKDIDHQYLSEGSTIFTSQNKGEIESLLLKGEADIGLIEMSWGDGDFNSELNYNLIGYEAPLFITSAKNTTVSLSKEDVIEIYTNNTPLDWSKFGGQKGKIKVLGNLEHLNVMNLLENTILIDKTFGTNQMTQSEYNELFVDYDILKPPAASFSKTNDFVIACVPFYHFSLTFPMDLGDHEKIKPILYENSMPTNEDVKSGKYPSIRVYAVTKKSADEKDIKEFIDWITNDEQSGTIKFVSGLGLLNGIDQKTIHDMWYK